MKNYLWSVLFLLCLWIPFSMDIEAKEDDPVIVDTTEAGQDTVDEELANSAITMDDPDSEDQPANENTESEVQAVPEASVEYQTHIQNIGWQEKKVDGQMAGTTGQSKRIEAVWIHVDSQLQGGIQYRTHVQNKGWTEWTDPDSEQWSGTTGKGLRIEAIQIRLLGELENYYSIYYRTHIQDYGWLGWAGNGEFAGTQSYGKRMEALQIVLLKKEQEAPISNNLAFYAPYVGYQTHVQTYGWQNKKTDGEMAGTSGESKRLEAIRLSLMYPELKGHILYRTHIQNVGWQNWKQDGQISGTTGQSLRLEGIQIKLTGEAAGIYDVYYRVHAQDYGWLEWTSNGNCSGTEGLKLRLEGIEIRLVKKEEDKPSSVNTVSFLKKNIPYMNDAIVVGWQRMNNGYYYSDPQKGLLKGFHTLEENEYGFNIRTGKQFRNTFVYLNDKGYGKRDRNVVYFDTEGVLIKHDVTLNKASIKIDPNGIVQSVTHNGIKYYSQLDGKWANKTFGYWTMGATGCLPTVATMVINYLLNLNKTPADIAQDLYKHKYYNNPKYGKGTIASAWNYLANQFGLTIQYIYTNDALKSALAHGNLVVGAVESTLFGEYGYTHELLLYNYKSSNQCQAYDPYFKSNNKSFSIDKIWSNRTRTKEDRLNGACFFSVLIR